MCLRESVHVLRFPSLHGRFVINERSYQIILIAVFLMKTSLLEVVRAETGKEIGGFVWGR